MNYSIIVALVITLLGKSYAACPAGTNCYPRSGTLARSGSTQIQITEQDDGTASQFDVTLDAPKGCYNPKVSYKFELIDYNQQGETITVANANGNQLGVCGNGQFGANDCGTLKDCFTDVSLGADIAPGTSYTMTVTESQMVTAWCYDGGIASANGNVPDTINSILTVTCECDASFLRKDCSSDPNICPACMQCCEVRKECEYPPQFAAHSGVDKVLPINAVPSSGSNYSYYGVILLMGVIAFVLINNIFIGYWCVCKDNNQNKMAYGKCDVVINDE